MISEIDKLKIEKFSIIFNWEGNHYNPPRANKKKSDNRNESITNINYGMPKKRMPLLCSKIRNNKCASDRYKLRNSYQW